MNTNLRCFVEKQPGGVWESICLDLNLHAHGNTWILAKTNLHENICQYIEEAETEDSDYINDLIPRYAPMYFWVRYYWCRIFALVSKTRTGSAYLDKYHPIGLQISNTG